MGAVTGTTLLVYALIAVIALVILIAKFKLNPFITLVVVSVALASPWGCRWATSSSRSKRVWAARSGISRS
jgi:Mg2+/citrate symporter